MIAIELHVNNFWKFTAKLQKNGSDKGKWAVYRPDGIRLIVCESRKQAGSLAWSLNYATEQFEKEGKGDWHTLMAKGE